MADKFRIVGLRYVYECLELGGFRREFVFCEPSPMLVTYLCRMRSLHAKRPHNRKLSACSTTSVREELIQ